MKSHLAALAAALSLLSGSPSLIAGELPFNAPATPSAKASMDLLHRAARALYDFYPNSTQETSEGPLADLWLFPTDDAGTVFAEYTLRIDEQGASPTRHLALLTLQSNGLFSVRELTDVVGEPTAEEFAFGGTRSPAPVNPRDASGWNPDSKDK